MMVCGRMEISFIKKKGVLHMKNRKYSLFVVLVLSVALFLAACGSSDDAKSDDKDNAEDASDYSVGLVTDVGGVDDKSFNQSSWEGLQEWEIGRASCREG